MDELIKEIEQAVKLLDFIDFDNYHITQSLNIGDVEGAKLSLKTQEERIGEAIRKLAAVSQSLRNLLADEDSANLEAELSEIRLKDRYSKLRRA